MNTRIWSIVATVTLLSLSSGCGTMKTFWFGRGARCGICGPRVNTAPMYVAPQPVAAVPYAPAIPAAPCQPQYAAPQYQQPVVTAPARGFGFGCLDRWRNKNTGNVYAGGCGTCGGGCGTCSSCESYGSCSVGCGTCAGASPCGDYSHSGCSGGCGGSCSVDPYGSVNDPYLSSATIIDPAVINGSMPYDGQIISDQVIGESIVGSGVPGSSGLQDNFDARGDRIIHSEPLPSGAVLNQ